MLKGPTFLLDTVPQHHVRRKKPHLRKVMVASASARAQSANGEKKKKKNKNKL